MQELRSGAVTTAIDKEKVDTKAVDSGAMHLKKSVLTVERSIPLRRKRPLSVFPFDYAGAVPHRLL